MGRARRGQSSVEYMLLLCAMVTVACLVGYFLKHYAQTLIDSISEKILDAFFILAFG